MRSTSQFHKATAVEKVNWILEHWDMCKDYPNFHAGKLAKHINIIKAMKREGLFSASTYPPDVKLVEYIDMARDIKSKEIK